jgi:hypothetical protein
MWNRRTRPDFAEVAARLQRLGGRRFAWLEVREQEGRITTYWVGHPPKRVQRFAGTRPDGIDIELVTAAAAYGETALLAAARRVRHSLHAAELGVTGVEVNVARTGLEIEVRDLAGGPALLTALAQVARLPLNAIGVVERDDRPPMP